MLVRGVGVDDVCRCGKFRDIFGYSEVGLITGMTLRPTQSHATAANEAIEDNYKQTLAAHVCLVFDLLVLWCSVLRH